MDELSKPSPKEIALIVEIFHSALDGPNASATRRENLIVESSEMKQSSKGTLHFKNDDFIEGIKLQGIWEGFNRAVVAKLPTKKKKFKIK